MNMASNVIEEETDNDMDWNVVSHKKKSKKFFGHSEDTRSDTHRHKRKRRSTGGASNSSPKSDDINKPKISNETFKNYSTDEKLDCIFSMLQNMTLTNVHVQKLESAMREVKSDTAKVKSRVDVLAYKSIDSEARQRRNNLALKRVLMRTALMFCLLSWEINCPLIVKPCVFNGYTAWAGARGVVRHSGIGQL